MNNNEAKQLLILALDTLTKDSMGLFMLWSASYENEYPDKIRKLRDDVKNNITTLRLVIDFGFDGVPVIKLFSHSLDGEEQLFDMMGKGLDFKADS